MPGGKAETVDALLSVRASSDWTRWLTERSPGKRIGEKREGTAG